MNKKVTILLIETLLMLYLFKPRPELILTNFADSERCSNEVEHLKLCVETSKVVVNSGEPVRFKVFWANSSDKNRRIGNRSSGYSVTVTDKSGNKLIPVYEQKFIEKLKQQREAGEEGKGAIMRVSGGGDRGLHAEANGVEKDEIALTDAIAYDYDLAVKGVYSVRIEKAVPSIDGKEQITFVIDNVEVEVK